MRGLAHGGIVISRHVDDRHGNAPRLETIPELDARSIAQVHVQDDAGRAVEIVVLLERFC